jgi:hypothetical protein
MARSSRGQGGKQRCLADSSATVDDGYWPRFTAIIGQRNGDVLERAHVGQASLEQAHDKLSLVPRFD